MDKKEKKKKRRLSWNLWKTRSHLTPPLLSARFRWYSVLGKRAGAGWLYKEEEEEGEEEVTGLQTRLVDEFVNVISARGIYRSISSTLPSWGRGRVVKSRRRPYSRWIVVRSQTPSRNQPHSSPSVPFCSSFFLSPNPSPFSSRFYLRSICFILTTWG